MMGRLVVAIGVVVALLGAWHLDRALAFYTGGLLLVYLGSKR